MASSNSHHAATLEYLETNNRHGLARAPFGREPGSLIFNMGYFEDCFIRGAFDIAQDYLLGFTGVHDNIFSVNVFFELRWHKFLAALSENKREEARAIINNDLAPLHRYNEYLVGFSIHLVNMPNFRLHEAFLNYGHPEYHRRERVEFVKLHLEANPMLHGKIVYPNIIPNLIDPVLFPTVSPLPVGSLIPVTIAPLPVGSLIPVSVPATRAVGSSASRPVIPGQGNISDVMPHWFPRRI